jgi:hypothetical protein
MNKVRRLIAVMVTAHLHQAMANFAAKAGTTGTVSHDDMIAGIPATVLNIGRFRLVEGVGFEPT